MTTDTNTRTAVTTEAAGTLRLMNVIASLGGIAHIADKGIEVSGKTASGQRLTLQAEAVSILLGEKPTVHLEGGWSCGWDELSREEKDAVAKAVARPWLAPAGIDTEDEALLAEAYLHRRRNIQFISCNGDLDATDFERIRATRALVEAARSFPDGTPKPLPGDTVCGSYYEGSHPFEHGMLDTPYPWQEEEGFLLLCAQPYSPFTSPSGKKKEGYCLSTSGGPFFRVKPEHLEYDGTEQRMFTVWGHNGACANGSLRFPVTVNRWRLSPEAGI